MVWKTLTLTVPKGTPERLPASVEVSVGVSYIIGGEVQIPGGAAGLVGVRLFTRRFPVFPADSGWIQGNDLIAPFSGRYPMEGPPYLVRLEAYNLDDTYAHTVEARIQCATEYTARRVR